MFVNSVSEWDPNRNVVCNPANNMLTMLSTQETIIPVSILAIIASDLFFELELLESV